MHVGRCSISALRFTILLTLMRTNTGENGEKAENTHK